MVYVVDLAHPRCKNLTTDITNLINMGIRKVDLDTDGSNRSMDEIHRGISRSVERWICMGQY